MHYVTTALAIIALAAVAIFSIQNLGPVEVDFLFWSRSIPKVLVIIGSYLLGMITGWGLVEIIKRYLKA